MFTLAKQSSGRFFVLYQEQYGWFRSNARVHQLIERNNIMWKKVSAITIGAVLLTGTVASARGTHSSQTHSTSKAKNTVTIKSHSFNSSVARATLRGTSEVPPVTTNTWGTFSLTVNQEKDLARFNLNVFNGQAVTMAHLHCGAVGQNGPIVTTLFGLVPGGFNVNGRLAKFALRNANIEPTAQGCSPAINTLTDLVTAVNAGTIYANVHTVAHPTGEIRGQLTTLGSSSVSSSSIKKGLWNVSSLSCVNGQCSYNVCSSADGNVCYVCQGTTKQISLFGHSYTLNKLQPFKLNNGTCQQT